MLIHTKLLIRKFKIIFLLSAVKNYYKENDEKEQLQKEKDKMEMLKNNKKSKLKNFLKKFKKIIIIL